MLKPVFRIVGSFFAFVGLFAGAGAFQRLIYGADIQGFLILAIQAVIYVVLGLRIRDWAGDLNLVSLDPEQIATHFAIPTAFGLGKNAGSVQTFLAGALAGAFILSIIAFLGLITTQAMIAAIIVFALYGGVLSLIKRAYLRKGGLKRHREGGYYALHRRVSVIVVPAITIVWCVATLPEATPLLVATIVLGLGFWLGQAFHALWEVLHTALLALYYGEHAEQTITWGLYEWFYYTRRDADVDRVSYDAERKRVEVVGRLSRVDQLRTDVLKLDFIEAANFIEANHEAQLQVG